MHKSIALMSGVVLGMLVASPAMAATRTSATAGVLKIRQVPVHVHTTSCQGKAARKGCPELNIQFIQASDPWVTQTVNRQLAGFMQQSHENMKGQNIASFNGLKPQSQPLVRHFIQGITRDSLESARNGHPPSSFDLEATYLGEQPGTGQLAISRFNLQSYAYTGGAHGMGQNSYLLLDRSRQKIITLGDLLEQPGQVNAVRVLLQNCYEQYVADSSKDAEDKIAAVADYKKVWPFVMTNNIDLDQSGLTFVYQPYEIAPYASGMPAWTIPYSRLNGILKPQYLPAGAKKHASRSSPQCDTHLNAG